MDNRQDQPQCLGNDQPCKYNCLQSDGERVHGRGIKPVIYAKIISKRVTPRLLYSLGAVTLKKFVKVSLRDAT